ncbi:MAG: FAD-dependent oxidoreductase, partial [bacterium]|nr:FAD-dependent oxidoreductase [bacterium]
AKIYQDRVFKNPKIEVIWDTVISEVQGETFVNNLRLKNTKTGEEKDLNVDGLFIFIGQEPNTQFLKSFCSLDDYGYINTDVNMKTKFDGIFAAGDVRKKELYQISTAVGDGAVAGYMAIKYLEELKCKQEEKNECDANKLK